LCNFFIAAQDGAVAAAKFTIQYQIANGYKFHNQIVH